MEKGRLKGLKYYIKNVSELLVIFACLNVIVLFFFFPVLSAFDISRFIANHTSLSNFTMNKSLFFDILLVSSNLTFVIMLLIDLSKQTESIENQKESIEAQKESIDAQKMAYQPIIKTDLEQENDSTHTRVLVANRGEGPAKNIKIRVELESKNIHAYANLSLGNLQAMETFTPFSSSEPYKNVSITHYGGSKMFSGYTPKRTTFENVEAFVEKTDPPHTIKANFYAENLLGERQHVGSKKMRLTDTEGEIVDSTLVKSFEPSEGITWEDSFTEQECYAIRFQDDSDLNKPDNFVV